MATDTRRFHSRYTRPANGAILETVDAVRFRVELEDLAVLSPFFESFLSERIRKPIQLALISSETLLFTLDLLTGSLGGGRAPKVPALTGDFLEELASLTFIYQLAGPLQYVAREAAGPRPHLGNSPNAVTAYTLLSLYQRWVAQQSPHLAAQLEKEATYKTPYLGLKFTEKEVDGWPRKALEEYHPPALSAMRAALSRRHELETKLDAIDALELEEECDVCDEDIGAEMANGAPEEDDGGDGYVHVATAEEIILLRRQRLLGPRLAKLEKLKDAALVAHLGYCVLRCRACRRVVRDMVLRLWTYGPLEEWSIAWHFGSADFKFSPAELGSAGHDCTGQARAVEQRTPSPSKTIRGGEDDERSGSGTPRPGSAASGASVDTAKGATTARVEGKDGIRDDHYDLYQAGLMPGASANGLSVEVEQDGESIKSGRSLHAASLTSAASSDGPFRYDDLADTSDSESSYGHLPSANSAEELDAQYYKDGGEYDEEDSFGHGAARILNTPTNVLGVIAETEEEYESSRDSFASTRNMSPNPVGAFLEREEEGDGETPAIVITGADSDREEDAQ